MNRTTVQTMRAQVIADHLLHRVDTSQLGPRDGVSLGHCITTPVCVLGYAHSDCLYPACECHAMPIKDLRTEVEHAEHLEATRIPTTAKGARIGLALCLISATAITLAILSTPETTKAALALLGL